MGATGRGREGRGERAGRPGRREGGGEDGREGEIARVSR
jgi:hypothetical protein